MAKRIVISFAVLAITAVIVWLLHTANTRVAAIVGLFFPKGIPTSMRLVAHGSERSIFGDGSSVAVFSVAEPDFYSLIEAAGFSKVEISDDPNHWRLELCNAVVTRLVKRNIQITPGSVCFAKESPENRRRARVYYDPTNHIAVGICFVSSKRGPG
jgi:hypothetical protein